MNDKSKQEVVMEIVCFLWQKQEQLLFDVEWNSNKAQAMNLVV